MKIFWILISILAGIALLFFLFVFLLASAIRKSVLGKRMEDDGTLHYFSPEDFGISCEETDFFSGKLRLKGYYYPAKEAKALIVLSHGMGAGQRQYMKEIASFVKEGFAVFSYDARGCEKSEGKGIGFFSNAVSDLKAALDFVKTRPEMNAFPLLLYGHSMGAYCVNRVLSTPYPIVGAVSVSSFDSSVSLIGDLLISFLGNKGKIVAWAMKVQEYLFCGKSSLKTSSESLKETEIPVLLISGDSDDIVPPEKNFRLYRRELSSCENIRFLEVEGRYHRPNLTREAADYDRKVNERISEMKTKYKKGMPDAVKRDLYDSFDYIKLVELDAEVQKEILNFYRESMK